MQQQQVRQKNSWCILRSSESLKYAIEYRIEQRNLKVKDLAKVIGVRKGRLYSYLDRRPHEGSRPSITQRQLLDLAFFLDINVELKVSFK